MKVLRFYHRHRQLSATLISWMNTATSTLTRDASVPLNLVVSPGTHFQLMTDASESGWDVGAYSTPNFRDLARFLPVLPHELAWASSYLSLSTTLFLFFPFGAVASELFSDNTTAITCILHQGNLRSDPLMLLSTHILEFYWHHSICQDPKLISGSLNVLPDQSSSPNPISMEWTLDRRTFEWVCSHVSSALRRVLNSKNCWNDLKWPLCDN